MAPKAFISYNHEDRDSAEKLSAALRGAGIEVIIDHKSMRAGNQITAFIKASIQSTDATISLISKNSLRSPWVARETMRAFEAERFASKKYLPCYLDKDFLGPGFVTEETGAIDEKIKKIAAERTGRIGANQKTTDLDGELSRLQDLRNSLPEIVGRLKDSLTVDLTDGAFDEGAGKLIEEIKRSEDAGEEEPVAEDADEEEPVAAGSAEEEPVAAGGDDTGEPITKDRPDRLLPPSEQPAEPWWKANMGMLVIVGFAAILAAWTAYKIPQLNRIESTVEAMAIDFFAGMSEQEIGPIEEMVGLPFYLGSDMLEDVETVRARFSTLFEHARQSTEQRSDSEQIRQGAMLSRFLSDQAAIQGYDLRDALDFTIRPDLESEDEADRASFLLPAAALLEDGARVSASIRGLASMRVDLYFSVQGNVALLRAVVIEQL